MTKKQQSQKVPASAGTEQRKGAFVATGGTDPKTGKVTPDEAARIKKAQADAAKRGMRVMGINTTRNGKPYYEEFEEPLPPKGKRP
jgi:hypothetical protein